MIVSSSNPVLWCNSGSSQWSATSTYPAYSLLHFTSNSEKYWIEREAGWAASKITLFWLNTKQLIGTLWTWFSISWALTLEQFCLILSPHLVYRDVTCVSSSPTKLKKADCSAQGLSCCQGRKLDRFEIVCPEQIHFGCYSSPYLSSWYFQTVRVFVPVLFWELKL